VIRSGDRRAVGFRRAVIKCPVIRGVVLAGLAALSAVVSAAPQSGPADRRVPFLAAELPAPLADAARAIAFVDVAVPRAGSMPEGGSAFLVSDCLLLTAQHVVDALTASEPKSAIRVRFPALKDKRGAPQIWTARVEARGGGALFRDPVADDWALLRLTEAPPLAPISLAPAKCCDWQKLPVRAAVAGFPADKFDAVNPALWVDPACVINRRLPIPVFATNCQATSGNSGGPLLVTNGEIWAAAAVLTRAPPPARRGVAAAPTSFALAVDGRITRAVMRAAKAPCPAPKAEPHEE
jgi:V8-like Glu-specific endopeptidase